MSWTTVISEKLKRFISSDITSDVTLIVGKNSERKEIQSHRFLLALFSDVFNAMFYGPLADVNKEFQFPEDDPDTFKRMLHYVYTGNEVTGSVEEITKLIRLADKYLIPELKLYSVNYLLTKISPGSVIQIYEVATELMEHKLRTKCWRYILDNTTEVLQEDSFVYSKISTIESIISKPYINVASELIVYKAVLNWGEEQCRNQQKEINSSNVRGVIGPLLPYVRFLAMTAEEFCKGPGKDKILNETEQLSTLKRITLKNPNEEYKLNRKGKRSGVGEREILFFSEDTKEVSPTSSFPSIWMTFAPYCRDIYVCGVAFYLSTTSANFTLPNVKECTLTVCNIDRNLKISKTVKTLENYKGNCRLDLEEPFFIAKYEKSEIFLSGENYERQALYYCSGDCKFGKSDFHFHGVFINCM